MKSQDKQYVTTFTSTLDSEMKTNTCTPPSGNPSYYKGAYIGLEAFDVCMDFARDSYNIGVAIAYLLRAGKKPDNPAEDDIRKAIDHLNKELQYIGYDREESSAGFDPTKNGIPKHDL